MRGSTFLLGPSSSDHRNAEKISLFVSLSFLSLSLSNPFSFMLASLLFSLIQLTPPFVCSPFYFLFIFSFLSFSHLFFFSLLFPFLHFLFYFSPLDCINRMVQKWETSSPLPPLPLVILTFFLIFFISLYFLHVTHGSI